MEIKDWLKQNNISFCFTSENIFTIRDIGSFYYEESDENVFDNEFNFLLDTDTGTDFIAYKFGGKYYYIKKDETKVESFKQLKYLGKAHSEEQSNYVNLSIHGSYEILNGSGLYKDYCKKAKFLGHETLGICEYNSLAGTAAFQMACREYNIQPVTGMTAKLRLGDNLYRDIKVYAKSEKGWRSLLRISSCIHIFNDGQFVTLEQLEQYKTDVLCIIGVDFDFDYLDKIKCIFEDVYCYIDPVEFKSQKKELEHLQQTKKYFDSYVDLVKPVVICDTFYIDKDHSHVKKLLNEIGNINFQNESNNQHYKTIDEIYSFKKLFSSPAQLKIFKEAISNTFEISDKCCGFKIDMKTMHLPKYYFKESETGYKDTEELFLSLIEKGFDKLVKGKVEDEQVYRDRIDSEVDVIRRGGFIDYFLILWDVIHYCTENNILTGVGRGSAGGSLVSYLLELIHLNPIKYDLLFERFLNEGRFDSVPDIDCDFETLRRDEVKRYMETRFGVNSVATIGAYTTVKVKSGLKDIGRALGYDHKTINIITSLLGDDMEGNGDDIIHLFKAAQVNPSLKKFVTENVDLINTVAIILRVQRAQSVHPSGVIILPSFDAEGNKMEIYDWVPVRRTPDGVLITDWECAYVDIHKFVKEDILGVAVLDKWAYTLKLIEEHTGVKLNIHKDIPIDDAETFRMFSIGFNEDVFQFSSDPIKKFSTQAKPETIEHLIAMNALYRPGPIDSLAHVDFCKIKNGEKEPEIDTGMEQFTGYTYGLWVYQEQLMLAYRHITGCSLKVTDDFRKIIAKFSHYIRLGMTLAEGDVYYQAFIDGYKEKYGVTQEYADMVWAKLIAFMGYGFNRSHATAYAISAYYCQYLKVHYPLQFWTTALHFSKEEELHKRISEINRSGQNIQLSPPDVNYSDYKIYADPNTNKIYWSFQKVKFCGSTSIDVIIQEREKNGKFYSFEEFIKRTPKKSVNKRTITYMIVAGCFDEIENIENVEDRIKLIYKHASIAKHPVEDIYKTAIVKNDYWWLIKQKEACGFGYIKYDKILNKNGFKGRYYNEIEFALPSSKGKDVNFAGVVIFVNKKKTKRGDVFAEIKCEVNSEVVFITVWPEQYEEYSDLINTSLDKIILVSGTIDFNKYKNQNVLMCNENTKMQTFEL